MILLICFMFLIYQVSSDSSNKNSSEVTICPTFRDYNSNKLSKEPNPNCHKEPIGNLEEWTQELNCTIEPYEITTKDDYILKLNRMYCGDIKAKYPILIGHGIFGNETIFFIGKEKSPGFAVVKAGYEVWTINFRGTSSSRHKHLNKSDKNFWKFSWHEMGVYDFPAAIEFIREYYKKKHGAAEKIIMVGTSMGSNALSTFGCELPDYAKEVALHNIHIAPVHSYLRNRPTHRVVGQIWPVVQALLKLIFNNGEVGTSSGNGSDNFCLKNLKTMRLCQFATGLVAGLNYKVIDPEVYPMYEIHSSDSGSSQTLIHSLQNIAYFHFTKFDHGPIKNFRLYNSIIPPKYKVSNINVNTTYFTSKNDGFADLQDIKKFYFNKLPESVQAGLHVMEPKKFCHIDYTAYNKYSLSQFTEPYLLPELQIINPLL